MPRPGITYFDVAKAAAQLLEQKQRPSIEAVRRLLGTGSNSTISHHLREWRKNHGNKIECEQGLPESLIVAVRGIYEAICTEANDNLEKLTQENKQITAELLLKVESLVKTNNQLLQEKRILEKAVSEISGEKSALERLNNKSNKTINEKITENNILIEKLNDRNAEIKRLTVQINHFQINLDHYRETIREERLSEKRTFEKESSTLKNDLQIQHKAVRQAEKEMIALKHEIEFLKSKKNEVENKLERSLKNCRKLEMDSHKIDLRHCNLKEQHDKLQSKYQSLKQASMHDKDIIAELNFKVVKCQEQLVINGNALQKSEEKLTNLSDKNLFLTHEKAELAGQLKQVLATA